MWIELITFLSKKEDLDEDYVVELLEKFVTFFGSYCFIVHCF